MSNRGSLRPSGSKLVLYLALTCCVALVLPAFASAADSTDVPAHHVRIAKDYYVSLCWYGLGQLGFGGQKFNPTYAQYASKMDVMVGDLGFRAPLVKGPMFQLIYQMPGYFSPQSPREMRELFGAMKRFVKSGSLEEFKKQWPDAAAGLREWFPGSAKGYFQKTLGGREDVVCQALDVWEEFLEVVWPEYQAGYDAKLKDYPFAKYQSQCDSLHAFEFWRREFGVDYPFADLILVICPENPTLATSIGPDKVVFGSIHSWNEMRNSVVHEIGLRYLSLSLLYKDPKTAVIMSADYDGMLRLIQTEVCFRTPRILPDLKRDSFVSTMRLERLMAWRAKQEAAGGLSVPSSKGPAQLLLELYVRARREGVL